MSGLPLVSVCLPVYNGERFIRQALESLLGQTYKNLEVVVSDNASIDHTEQIAREYAANDPRLRYQRNASNLGYTTNLRRAVELATGEFVMFASVDDTRPQNVIETCVNALMRNSRAVMAHGPIVFVFPDERPSVRVANPMDMDDLAQNDRVKLFARAINNGCMVYGLYRKEALARCFYPNTYAQEYVLLLQMTLLGPLVNIDQPMLLYRLRKTYLNTNPLYDEIDLTLANLLTAGPVPRVKCWTALLVGGFYLLRVDGVKMLDRVTAVIAHTVSFATVYKRRLAKEVVFQLFYPVSCLCSYTWAVCKKFHGTADIARKVKSRLAVKRVSS